MRCTPPSMGRPEFACFSIALVLLTMILTGCNIQNNFLYFPDPSAPSGDSLKEHDLRPWPSSIDCRGLVKGHEEKCPKGTVVIFHGNAGSAVNRAFYTKALVPLGYRVILAEYPAYGGRKGKVGEESFVADGRKTIRLAFEEFGEPLFLLGESLGCGVAAALAKEATVRVDGIVLITPWDTLLSVAHSKFPFLPVRLLLTDKYDTVNNLKSFKGKIAIVGAGKDEIIPIGHAQDLYDSLQGRKRMWVFQEAGHNNWPFYAHAAWWKEIMDFVSGKADK